MLLCADGRPMYDDHDVQHLRDGAANLRSRMAQHGPRFRELGIKPAVEPYAYENAYGPHLVCAPNSFIQSNKLI